MTMVRFATTCDGPCCGVRSEEYHSWAMCRECSDHFCLDCREPGTTVDADVDQPEVCVCRACAARIAEDAAATVHGGER